MTLEPDDFWAALREQVAGLSRACEDRGRDPASLRRSLLLGYGTVKPLADVASYVEAAERAASTGFYELVVYWGAGKLADDNYDEFIVNTYLAAGLPANTTLYFPVVQECENGVHRWQQGYYQRETIREWGHLQYWVLEELEDYALAHPEQQATVMPIARRAWQNWPKT